MKPLLAISLFLSLNLLAFSPAFAQQQSPNMLPNPSFEVGEDGPADWTVSSIGAGGWESGGHLGDRCVSITGMGDDATWWTPTLPLRFDPGSLYRVSYWLRREPQARGGAAVAGLDRVARQAPPTQEWRRTSFVFRTPDSRIADAFFLLGQRGVRGKLLLDDVTLTPALAVHVKPAGIDLPLGRGERIDAGSYTAAHPLAGPAAPDFRCLQRFNALFDTDRWIFMDEAYLLYLHQIGRLRHTDAEVEVGVIVPEQGQLLIEASLDGDRWTAVGEMTETSRLSFPLPPELLPARSIWIRLRSTEGSALEVNAYRYRSRLEDARSIGAAVGATQYLSLLRDSPDLHVELNDLGGLQAGGECAVDLSLATTASRRSIWAGVAVHKDGAPTYLSQQRVSLSSDASRRVTLPYRVETAGDHILKITCIDTATEELLWESQLEFTAPQ